MSMKTIIAIDPGASGGVAVRYPDGKVSVDGMPATEGDLLDLLRSVTLSVDAGTAPLPAPVTCYLEDLVKHMGAGIPASTMAVYASNWGYIKGAVSALGIRLELVRPQEWQKGLGLVKARKTNVQRSTSNAELSTEEKSTAASRSAAKREWKNRLKGEAQRLFPGVVVTLETADALLMLEWATKKVSSV